MEGHIQTRYDDQVFGSYRRIEDAIFIDSRYNYQKKFYADLRLQNNSTYGIKFHHLHDLNRDE